jgi:membrane fusion protein (multidrug efflux system)
MKRVILLLTLFAIICETSCTTHATPQKEEVIKFTVTSPIEMDTTFEKEYIAQIQSIQNVEIRAQVKGYLEGVNVDEGKPVSEGQVIFSIMPKMYEAEVMKQKAEVKKVEIELMNTKVLADKKIISNAELAMAEAKLEGEKAELAKAALDVSFTKIKAPFSGVIDRIKFKKGSLIDEGGLLTTLSNNKNVFAYFNVSEVEYLDFKSRKADDKQTVSLLLANGQMHKYKGAIETIESEFDNETGNLAFRAKFPNPELLLKHGETGKVRLTIPLKNALIIPQKCTYELQDKIYVYVVDKDNKLKSRNITIKQRLSNIYIIDKGLETTDKILLDGLQFAKEDEKIETEFVPAKEVFKNLQLIKQY